MRVYRADQTTTVYNKSQQVVAKVIAIISFTRYKVNIHVLVSSCFDSNVTRTTKNVLADAITRISNVWKVLKPKTEKHNNFVN